MSVLLFVLGVLLVGFAGYDAVVTTLSTTKADGPATSWIGRSWWRAAHRLARRPDSPVLTSAGPLVLIVTIGAWLIMLWVGWTLIFSADPSAIVSSAEREPADWSQRAYFAGFTAFTLGIGDYVPVGTPWRLLTVVASASGLGLTTAAITYLMPVVTASTERSAQSATIAALGGDAHAIVRSAYHEGSVRYLEAVLIPLTSALMLTAERHVTYPILHYFHPGRPDLELRIQLANLEDALVLVDHGLSPEVVRPHPAAISGIRAAMSQITERAPSSSVDQPAPLDLAPLRATGVPVVDDATFAACLQDVRERHMTLSAYAAESMWSQYS